MTTPPSSPALSEARERDENHLTALLREALRESCDQGKMQSERNREDESLRKLYWFALTLARKAHASGLAAGREQAEAEWRKRVEEWTREYQARIDNTSGDAEGAAIRWHEEGRIEALAALRSPVGG